MANLNKVMLIGRLTRDPEVRAFQNGGKVAKFGFAVNNRKKLPDGSWGDEPVFVDVSAFNRETGRKLADLVEQYMKKGHQFYLEGHLVFEQWDDKQTGAKRSVLRVVLDDFQFLEPRQDGAAGEGDGGSRFQRKPTAPQQTTRSAPTPPSYDEHEAAAGGGGNQEDIPF